MFVFKTPRRAFTLSEFVVSLTILGLIAALSIPSFISSMEERKRMAIFRESLVLVESALKKYCASPEYGSRVFYHYLVGSLRQVQSSAMGTATTNTTVTFRNGSRVIFNPTSRQMTVQWDADNTSDTITLDVNPVKDRDLLVNGRNLKACEIAPIPAQRGLYATALGLRVEEAPSAEYEGNTSQLINPDDAVISINNTVGTAVMGTTVNSGGQYGARNGGFT